MKRSVKLYGEKGPEDFFERPKRRGPAVLAPPVIQEVQEFLANDHSLPEIGLQLGLKVDTLRKAVSSGRLHKPKKNLATHNGRTCPQ